MSGAYPGTPVEYPGRVPGQIFLVLMLTGTTGADVDDRPKSGGYRVQVDSEVASLHVQTCRQVD
eukprot:2132868-Rhodomonas_salina.1